MFASAYRAAAVQMNSSTDLQENLDQAYNFIQEAAGRGTKVVGLPENFAYLGGLAMRIKRAKRIAEQVPSFLAETANEFNIYLMGGSYPVPADSGKVYNHSALYNPEGKKVAGYDKVHLFDVSLGEEERYIESSYVEAGQPKPEIYSDQMIGSWGLSVCYDLRFPEYFRQLVHNGAQILSVPSAFTYTTGQDHWELLLRARAVENTSYIFAPAQTGTHGEDRKTWGHAMIVDPWGKVVADAGSDPGVVIAEIDPDRIAEVRTAIPSLEHRIF